MEQEKGGHFLYFCLCDMLTKNYATNNFYYKGKYEAQLILSIDYEKQNWYFILLLCVHMCGSGNTILRNCIGDVTEQYHSKL